MLQDCESKDQLEGTGHKSQGSDFPRLLSCALSPFIGNSRQSSGPGVILVAMKYPLGFLVLACSIALAQTTPTRPPLTGISHIAVYAADPVAEQHYYVDIVGCEK